MKAYLQYFMCFIVFINILPNSFGIKCWDCESIHDQNCADPFDNSTLLLTDCDKLEQLVNLPGVRPKMCRKTIQRVNGEWRYIRGCGWIREEGVNGDERICLQKYGSGDIFIEYCTCESRDGCNSSFTLRAKLLLHILVVMPVVFVQLLS